MIQIQGQYDLADFKKAQTLHADRERLATWAGYGFIGVLIISTLVGIIVAIMGSLLWSYAFYPALVLGVYLLFQFVLRPRQLARMFKQQQELSAPFELELTEEEFIFKNQFGAGHLPWSHFVRWKENQDMLLLYRSDVMFNMLPKRLFRTPAELDYLRERLRQNNVPNKVRNSFQWVAVGLIILVAIVVLLLQLRRP